MPIINNIHGTSLLSNIINVPIEYGTNSLSTYDNSLMLDTNFRLLIDDTGTSSIIELDIVPYIDMSYFDYDRQTWFNVDKYGTIWRHYIKGNHILELNRIYDDTITCQYNINNNKSGIYFSLDNLFKNNNTIQEYLCYDNDSAFIDELDINEYKPIKLIIEGDEYKNITDYNFNIEPKLNYIAPEINKEFYIKNNIIYTNTDLTLYKPQDINIEYQYTTSEIKVHCVMDTNSPKYSNYTPIVDYYILKLTGQQL